LILAGGLFAYILYTKPEYIAILLFTLVIANINIDISALPLNSRAIITLALFGRILIDKSPRSDYPSFLNVSSVKLLIIFLLYILLGSFSQGLFTIELVKQDISIVLSTFCVFYYFLKEKNADLLKVAMIASGLLCFADLVYTYMVYGTFPVQRIYVLLTGGPADSSAVDYSEINHNFYGQICGMGFIYLFADFIKNHRANMLNILLLPVMFLGVLMSTSRSALLGILLVFILVILKGIAGKEQIKRVYRVVSFSIGSVAGIFILFMTVSTYFDMDSEFLDSITSRLIDEPVAVVNKALGNSYNINNLSSMDWRGEAAADAYAAYMKLDFNEQFFGIGNGGFIARDMGHGLNPHNGILLILIENGLLGFIIYLIIIAGTFVQALSLKNVSPALAVLAFIIIYGLGQNQELTSITTFLFVYTVVAENQYIISKRARARMELRNVKKMKMTTV